MLYEYARLNKGIQACLLAWLDDADCLGRKGLRDSLRNNLEARNLLAFCVFLHIFDSLVTDTALGRVDHAYERGWNTCQPDIVQAGTNCERL